MRRPEDRKNTCKTNDNCKKREGREKRHKERDAERLLGRTNRAVERAA